MDDLIHTGVGVTPDATLLPPSELVNIIIPPVPDVAMEDVNASAEPGDAGEEDEEGQPQAQDDDGDGEEEEEEGEEGAGGDDGGDDEEGDGDAPAADDDWETRRKRLYDSEWAKLQRAVDEAGVEIPEGWRLQIVRREKGGPPREHDYYYYDPNGKKYRSYKEALTAIIALTGPPGDSEDGGEGGEDGAARPARSRKQSSRYAGDEYAEKVDISQALQNNKYEPGSLPARMQERVRGGGGPVRGNGDAIGLAAPPPLAGLPAIAPPAPRSAPPSVAPAARAPAAATSARPSPQPIGGKASGDTLYGEQLLIFAGVKNNAGNYICKEGIFYPEPYLAGISTSIICNCKACNGRMRFAPSGFERHAGSAAHNPKRTIKVGPSSQNPDEALNLENWLQQRALQNGPLSGNPAGGQRAGGERNAPAANFASTARDHIKNLQANKRAASGEPDGAPVPTRARSSAPVPDMATAAPLNLGLPIILPYTPRTDITVGGGAPGAGGGAVKDEEPIVGPPQPPHLPFPRSSVWNHPQHHPQHHNHQPYTAAPAPPPVPMAPRAPVPPPVPPPGTTWGSVEALTITVGHMNAALGKLFTLSSSGIKGENGAAVVQPEAIGPYIRMGKTVKQALQALKDGQTTEAVSLLSSVQAQTRELWSYMSELFAGGHAALEDMESCLDTRAGVDQALAALQR